MAADHRDLVIEMLSDDYAALIDHIAALEASVQIYRELAQAGIHQLHGLTRKHDRLRAQHHQLLEEYRRLREQTMGRVAA